MMDQNWQMEHAVVITMDMQDSLCLFMKLDGFQDSPGQVNSIWLERATVIFPGKSDTMLI